EAGGGAQEDLPSLEELLPRDLPARVPLLQDPKGRRVVIRKAQLRHFPAEQQDGRHDDHDPERPHEQADEPPRAATAPPEHGQPPRSCRIRWSSSAEISPRANRSSAIRMAGEPPPYQVREWPVDSPFGSTIQSTTYSRSPNPMNAATTKATRTRTGSMPK